MNAILKSARETKKLNTRKVSELTGIDQALISKFENGLRNPTKSQLILLADILDIDHEYLTIAWIKQKIKNTIGIDHQTIKAMKIIIQESENIKSSPEKFAAEINLILTEIEILKLKVHQISKQKFETLNQLAAIQFTIESNQIHGNSIIESDARRVIMNGETISGKTRQEHLEIINHHEALIYVHKMVSSNYGLNDKLIFKLHNLLHRGIAPDNLDRYRNSLSETENTIKNETISNKMIAFFDWFTHFKTKIHPILLACQTHEKFATIQAFESGNGRISRLLLQFILLQKGYLLTSNLKHSNTNEYVNALETSRKTDTIEPFLKYISAAEKVALENYIAT